MSDDQEVERLIQEIAKPTTVNRLAGGRTPAWAVWALAATIAGVSVFAFSQEEGLSPDQFEAFTAMAFGWVVIAGIPVGAFVFFIVRRTELKAPSIAVALAVLLFIFWYALTSGFFFLA